MKLTLQDLLNRVRKEQSNFPPAQRLVAAYVVENYHQIPFLSITTLSNNLFCFSTMLTNALMQGLR
ncbi:MAG: hypothetical protein ACOX7N_08545 [Lawsonibacter sp.]